ncbi:MAG: ATP-binding protein [Muribaculaceae bacterium]
MKFVDRIEESGRLTKALASDTTSFVVVYGRRRLGKSTLIKRVLTADDTYYLADQTEAIHQREVLAKMIGNLIEGFDKVIYPDWDSLLDTLNNRLTKKFTLCIDEFPYLVSACPELPSILQKKLDSKEIKYNLIVCGSSQQLMYGLVLDSTSPLYGRADVILKITPIKLPYIQQALKLSDIESVEEYAVWGGVPRYWELREGDRTLVDSIKSNLLSVNGTLYEEPMKLFKDDINDIVKTSTIMSYVGLGANRLSEIAGRCGEVSTNLSRPLAKLVTLGYLEKEIPFGDDEKNAKKSLYKISDPFMNFYFRFIVPNRSFIELGRIKPILSAYDTQFTSYVGHYWEKLCRESVSGNEIDGITYGIARRWWGSVSRTEKMEIDVIAESLDKKYLFVGECKWTAAENADRLLSELKTKAEKLPFAKNHIIVTKLFLKNKPLNESKDVLLPTDIIQLIRQ